MRMARPAGISAMSFFFLFGMTMSGLAAISLASPGGVLEAMWQINPKGREGLGAMGLPAVALMATVSLACAGAAAGLWLGRLWGWWLAVTILAINATADLLNGIFGNDPRTLIGLPVAGAMLYYLRTARVRAFFAADRR
ncbi:MAG: hypothetical protein WB973_11225 [Thermoanaerobaculia bacterium]